MRWSLDEIVLAAIGVCALVTPALAQYQGPGFALNFTSSNGQYVQVPAHPSLTPDQFTFEAWVKPSTAKCHTILSRGHGGNANTDYIFMVGYDGATCGVMKVALYGAGAWDSSTNTVPTNTWTHVAVTYDGTNKQFYINGMPDAVKYSPGPLFQSGSPMFIGRQGLTCNCNFFDGEIDEVRLWYVVRTPDQIQQNVHRRLFGLEGDLIAYYRLDDGAGGTLTDYSGNGHGGTLGAGANAPAWMFADEPLGLAYLSSFLPTSLTAHSATLDATVNPEAQATAAWFQWGTTPSYGSNTPITDVGSGSVSLPVSATLSGLSAGTYYYQFVATNSSGTSLGPDFSFTIEPSEPEIFDQASSDLSRTSARLNASVFANGLPATVWFQYGPTTNYGSVTPSIAINDNLGEFVPVDIVVGGLSPGALYHFQCVATNASGAGFGTDQTFVTPNFVQFGGSLGRVVDGSAAWGDYDGDGQLDLLLSGYDGGFGPHPFSKVWRNTGAGFTDINAGLPPVYYGSVVWGDLYNDGHLDLLLSGNGIAQIWRNTGTGFADINAGLSGFESGGAAWGDYDNDGRLDVLITGQGGNFTGYTQLWRNTGHGFEYVETGLPGMYYSAVAWGDYDNDGRLDILLAGRTDFGLVTDVWRNTGTGFTNINAGLPGIMSGAVAWADYDNDGRLDILLCGLDGNQIPIAQVWRNTPDGFVYAAGLPGIFQGAGVWGDYDNDGRPDILLTGYNRYPPNNRITQLWRNTGTGFTSVNAGLTALGDSAVAWGDFDNDGRLDLILSGGFDNNSPPVIQVWQNLTAAANTPPSAPTGLAALVTNSTVRLAWNAASDVETPPAGLSYNVRVGTTPGGSDAVSPQANPTNGFRLIPALGNAQKNLFAIVNELSPGPYYWSVQAIDTAYAGSAFAPESSFMIPFTPPVITGLAYTNGQFQIHFDGYHGGNYTLHASTNLVQWSEVANFLAPTNGNYRLQDSGAFRSQFYRLDVR